MSLTEVSAVCTDRVILDRWHPISALAETTPAPQRTQLLGAAIAHRRVGDAEPEVWLVDDAETPDAGPPLPVLVRYGYVWTSLGHPIDLFEIPEFDEPDRRRLNAGSIHVATSAPRAVENFLDLGHFPYVHTGLLGAEPHTEVTEYDVDIVDGEIWATRCQFFQPQAAQNASGGQMTQYTYRVPHPYCVLLYKSCAIDPTRRDTIGLFLQATSPETCRAHNFLCMVDEESTDTQLRRFQQLIFGQDKPILENQQPKRLPLDPRVETPIRADKSAITYRRWLTELGVRYAVVPAD